MTELIQQLYCTHCTYGTSALHRRDGAMGAQAFEYSTRSGSVPRPKSHEYFRQVEPYMYYRLPGDTPPDDFLRLSALSSPHRLIYFPSVSGLKVLAQLCYRPTDTRGRPGSYFGHVLFSEQPEARLDWSPQHCLQLWGAPGWVVADGAELPFELGSLNALETLSSGRRPAIDEQVLLSFLTSPAGIDFDDPMGIIPQRWKDKTPAERQTLLVDSLNALFELNLPQRETFWLAVEPSVAALIYFGIFRLLPSEGLAAQLSFSTFESHADRPATILAATMFHDPQSSDLPREAYQSRGFAINTWNGNRSNPRRLDPAPLYARTLVNLLVDPAHGWPAVDELLRSFESAKPGSPDELEELVQAERTAAALISPTEIRLAENPAASATWVPKSATARSYLQRVVATRLTAKYSNINEFHTLKQDPQRVLLILKSIAGTEKIPGTESVIAALCAGLPGDRLGELLGATEVALDYKVQALARYVEVNHALPANYEGIWSNSKKETSATTPALFDALCEKLTVTALARMLSSVFAAGPSEERLKSVCASVLKSTATDLPKRSVLVEFFDDAKLSESSRQALLRSAELRAKLFEQCTCPNPGLARQLQQLLQTLPEQESRFAATLEILLAGKRHLPDPLKPRVAAWDDVRRRLAEVEELHSQSPGYFARWFKQGHGDTLNEAGRNLAEAVGRAMPQDSYASDRDGTQRTQLLTRVARHLSDDGALPEGFPRKLQSYLSGNGWRDPAAAANAARHPERESLYGIPAAWLNSRTAAVAALLLVGLGIGIWFASSKSPAATARGSVAKKSPSKRARAELAKLPSQRASAATGTVTQENEPTAEAAAETESTESPATVEPAGSETNAVKLPVEIEALKLPGQKSAEPASASPKPTETIAPDPVARIALLPLRQGSFVIPPETFPPETFKVRPTSENVALGKGTIQVTAGKSYAFGAAPSADAGILEYAVPELAGDPIFAELEPTAVKVKLRIEDLRIQLEFEPSESTIKIEAERAQTPIREERENLEGLYNGVLEAKKKPQAKGIGGMAFLNSYYQKLCEELGLSPVASTLSPQQLRKETAELCNRAEQMAKSKLLDLKIKLLESEQKTAARITSLDTARDNKLTLRVDIYQKLPVKPPSGKAAKLRWTPILSVGEPGNPAPAN